MDAPSRIENAASDACESRILASIAHTAQHSIFPDTQEAIHRPKACLPAFRTGLCVVHQLAMSNVDRTGCDLPERGNCTRRAKPDSGTGPRRHKLARQPGDHARVPGFRRLSPGSPKGRGMSDFTRCSSTSRQQIHQGPVGSESYIRVRCVLVSRQVSASTADGRLSLASFKAYILHHCIGGLGASETAAVEPRHVQIHVSTAWDRGRERVGWPLERASTPAAMGERGIGSSSQRNPFLCLKARPDFNPNPRCSSPEGRLPLLQSTFISPHGPNCYLSIALPALKSPVLPQPLQALPAPALASTRTRTHGSFVVHPTRSTISHKEVFHNSFLIGMF